MDFSQGDDGLAIPSNIFEAQAEIEVQSKLVAAADFRRRLKDVDSRLDLVYVGDQNRFFPEPRHWYIIRLNDMAPPNFWIVKDEDGTACLPDERHWKRFMALDAARHPDSWRELLSGNERRRARHEKRMKAKSEEFRERLLERLAHVYDPRMAVTPKMKKLLGPSGEEMRSEAGRVAEGRPRRGEGLQIAGAGAPKAQRGRVKARAGAGPVERKRALKGITGA